MKFELIPGKRSEGSGREVHLNLASLEMGEGEKRRRKKEEMGAGRESWGGMGGVRKMSAYDYRMNSELFLLFQPKTLECECLKKSVMLF